MNIDEILNFLIVIVNAILLIIIYNQLKDARKPIILTKIISRDKDVADRPDVLESGDQYIVITNGSNNVAKSLDIDYEFTFDKHPPVKDEYHLNHLNPGEATKILLKISSIIAKFPDLFEKQVRGNTTKIIPKETLKINLTITVRYNPIFWNFGKYRITDNYSIEWGSLENYPDFKDHPIFNCWNMRDGIYIYKIDGNVKNYDLNLLLDYDGGSQSEF
ncbi:MAG: hypothetical protein AB3K77_13495 [Methanosarcinaceae archaeon]